MTKASAAMEQVIELLKAQRQKSADDVTRNMQAENTKDALTCASEVARLQMEIESIERAIAEVQKGEPSVYETRALTQV